MKHTARVFESIQQVRDYFLPARQKAKTVVSTNGCFDLLHRGHVSYLQAAAALGDILIVGLNSDLSVQKLKGPTRPLQSEKDRAAVIASLGCVDAACIFTEDDPRQFISCLQPDIHVKGGDYSGEIIEKKTVESYGGKVMFLDFVPGHSTSALIAKMNT